MATRNQIVELLETLAGVYGVEPGEPKGYYWALEEYDAEILDEACKDAVRLLKWYPKPSELREIAERKQRERENSVENISRIARDRTYLLFDKYRAGEITAREFTADRATWWCYRQHGLFSALFDLEPDDADYQSGYVFEELIYAETAPAA